MKRGTIAEVISAPPGEAVSFQRWVHNEVKVKMIEPMPAAPRLRTPRSLAALAGGIVVFLSASPIPASAEVAVQGTVGEVRIEARDASVTEILAALGSAFGVKYRASIELNRPVTGTYRGPVVRVLSRLLTDYDYVVKSSAPDRIEVIVLRFSGKDSDKVISTLGGSYPHPLWRARGYSRKFGPNPAGQSGLSFSP
jgi:hypothetical protein